MTIHSRPSCETALITGIVSPVSYVDLRVVGVDDEGDMGQITNVNIIVIRVDFGSAPPYGIKPGKPEYYVRYGATTFPAGPEQIRSIVLVGLPAQIGLI